MAQHYLLKNCLLVNEGKITPTDVLIKNGRIEKIASSISNADGATEINAEGKHLFPGVIDDQVHFREPGMAHKEDLESGSRSAVMGGVTAVFEMPNTNPLTTTRETFEAKIAAGTRRMHCDFAFFIGGTRENYQNLPELERAPGCAGVKVFIGSSTGSLLVEDDGGLVECAAAHIGQGRDFDDIVFRIFFDLLGIHHVI